MMDKRLEEGGFLSFDMVEGRLVDALRLWRRMPDSDARFGLSGRISSLWSQYVPDGALTDVVPDEPRAPRPSRADIARMQEATNWLVHAPESDRALVILALRYLAAGKKRVPWTDLWRALGRGRPGPDGLRKRYSAAITLVANALNGGNPGGGVSRT
jgi:hypothetical protein